MQRHSKQSPCLVMQQRIDQLNAELQVLYARQLVHSTPETRDQESWEALESVRRRLNIMITENRLMLKRLHELGYV